MYRILIIAGMRLKNMLKMPSVWVLMVVMPLIFSGIFGNMAAGSATARQHVAIAIGNGETARQLGSLLMENDGIVWNLATADEAKQQVARQKAAVAVIIPDDVEDRIKQGEPPLQLAVQRETTEYLAVKPFLEGTAETMLSAYAISEKNPDLPFTELLAQISAAPTAEISGTLVGNDSEQADLSLFMIGFVIMFMMFGIANAASAILDERIGGTWSRLLTTPAKKWEIMLGLLLAYFLLGWVQFGVLMAAMSVLFQTDWGNLALLVPFASLVIVAIIGFGLLLAGLVKTRKQASALGALLIVSTCMLGGVYWPLDIVPHTMQVIARFTPQFWAMEGFGQIIGDSLHALNMTKAVLALTAFTAAFFAFGLRKVKFD